MQAKRVLTVLILIPGFILALLLKPVTPWLFNIAVVAFLGMAAYEFWQIFLKGKFQPSGPILMAGVVLLTLVRIVYGLDASAALLAFLILIAMAAHVFAYERGAKTPAVDFSITVAGLVYLGWLGPYLISTRDLPDGQWWLLLILLAVWLGDMFAYEVGRRIPDEKKHRLAPRTSPGKSWEGYIAGILISIVLSAVIAWLINRYMTPSITLLDGIILAAVLATITPLGDLGESLIKRQFGVKDSSNILPGHGGFLDRMDTWLWAAAIGFYLVVWFLI